MMTKHKDRVRFREVQAVCCFGVSCVGYRCRILEAAVFFRPDDWSGVSFQYVKVLNS